MDDPLKSIGEKAQATLGGAILEVRRAYGELTLIAEASRILDVLTFLRDDPECRFYAFIDISGADYPEREKRFEIVYHLLSPKHNVRVRVKLSTDEAAPVPSAVSVFPGADWYEREIYDLFGVLFDGHPLRKDFPMTGFVELRYDDEEKRVRYSPVRLTQEFRQFDFLSPWEGAPLPGDEKAK